jgi:CRISPR-associated endonuclease Csn1
MLPYKVEPVKIFFHTPLGRKIMWKLGLDLGTNSIGWSAFCHPGDSEPDWNAWSLKDAGVRIIPDGRQPPEKGRVGESLAVQRRQARGMRRNLDRRKNRLQALVQALLARGLLPAEPDARKEIITGHSPYALRAQAADSAHPLTAHQLGRVLLHLGLRRGFLSNRKSDSAEEATDFKKKISALHRALAHHLLTAEAVAALPDDTPAQAQPWTLGQFLWRREEAGLPLRFRGQDGDFYPDRALYRAEFEAIRAAQSPHHPTLTAEDWDCLRDQHILFQHPLRPVERGACSFYPDQPRTFRDTPIAQRFRILKEVSILRWLDDQQRTHRLDIEQFQTVVATLERQEKASFGGLRRLKRADETPLFEKGCRFNIEDEKRPHLDGNRVAVMMRRNPALERLWQDRTAAELDDIFDRLHTPLKDGTMMDDATLIGSLISDFALTRSEANALTALPLSSITTSYSRQAMEQLCPLMEATGCDEYDAAVALLGKDEADQRLAGFQQHPELLPALPYYGEILRGSMLGADPRKPAETDPEGHYGRIGNPTVHIALNQVRKLVNELIERFGEPPAVIQVELSRDLKLPKAKRDAIGLENARNERANKERAKWWAAMTNGAEPTPRDLKKIKLWEELARDEVARRCLFTGRIVSAGHLVNGEVEIEHILPRSRTLDDSLGNLTLSFRDANRLKGNRTPFEAFGHDQHRDQGIVWAEILERIKGLPPAKAARFAENAMDAWEVNTDFAARQMTDNATIARLARRYLTAVCPQVFPAPGRLTAMIRSQWRLNGLLSDDNQKNRNDHRHHTVDAFVIGLATRSMLQRTSSALSHGREQVRLPDLPDPLRDALRERLDRLVVSFKPDHGGQGAMFNETAYGFVDRNKALLVTRKPIASLSEKELDAIRDPQWKAKISDFFEQHTPAARSNTSQRAKLLAEFGRLHGVKSLRILVKNASVTPVASAPYKGYAKAAYVCCDVWAVPKGKPGKWKTGEWTWHGVFTAYSDCPQGQPPQSSETKPHPAARFVTRLFKDDLIAYDEGGQTEIMRVAGFSTTNNRIDLRPYTAAESQQKFYGINKLGAKALRKVSVSPSGVVAMGKGHTP